MSESPRKMWVLSEHIRGTRQWMDATPYADLVRGDGPHPCGIPYVILSEHDRVKAQRDALLEAARAGESWLAYDVPHSIRRAIRAAIAACEADDD